MNVRRISKRNFYFSNFRKGAALALLGDGIGLKVNPGLQQTGEAILAVQKGQQVADHFFHGK